MKLKYWEKLLLCYLWGMVWALLGIVLCATIVFAPVGFLAFTVAGWPLAKVQERRMKEKREWQNRDHPMPNSNETPWLIDDVEPDA